MDRPKTVRAFTSIWENSSLDVHLDKKSLDEDGFFFTQFWVKFCIQPSINPKILFFHCLFEPLLPKVLTFLFYSFVQIGCES